MCENHVGPPLFKIRKYSCLAQLVEYLTVNQNVIGSSPVAGAIVTLSSNRLGKKTFNLPMGVRVPPRVTKIIPSWRNR